MATINKAIRFYQPNDPYYWEVDNLPLTDLLNNDIVLEDRVSALEETINGLGNNYKGAFSLAAIADLKAYAEPLSGLPQSFGKVFVRPGKFVARMQLPASRDSGWRMMRDDDANFNNTSFQGAGGLASTTTDLDFVRATNGISRTSVVEFYAAVDGTDKAINIPAFDISDFNSAQAPQERLDLIFIKATQSLDTDWRAQGIPEASLGIIKGAYFRTDAAAGVKSNGPRFASPTSRLNGRTTGMSQAEILADATLQGFGTVPMPDDLANFAWHLNTASQNPSWTELLQYQVDTQAAFTLPIAYVRVPAGYVAGQPIAQENVIDIRPFLRTTELAYNERAAIAASMRPSGKNPFVTKTRLDTAINPITTSISDLAGQVQQNTSILEAHTLSISSLEITVNQNKEDITGTGSAATSNSLNHEGRIAALETSVGGGISVPIEKHVFLPTAYQVFTNQKSNVLGTFSTPITWDITQAIPAGDRPNIVAVQFRVTSWAPDFNDTDSPNELYLKGGVQNFRPVSIWAFRPPGGEHAFGRGNVNTFYADVTKQSVDGITTLSVGTYCIGSADVNHSIEIDGYITTQYAS